MGRRRVGTLLVVTAFLATACGERQIDTPTAPDLAGAASACNFNGTTGVKNLTRTEFGSNSAEATAATNMANAGAGTASATTYGYQILKSIGNKYTGTLTTTSNASALTVALLQCMNIGGAAVPAATKFDTALGAHGAFAVRLSSETAAVLSHDPNTWLLVPPSGQTWGQVSGTNAILVYGVPVTNNTFTNDNPLTGIFDWKVLPDVTFNDPGIVIGNCTQTGFLQHNAVNSGAEILAYLGDCSSVIAQATERAPRTFGERMFRLLSPQPAYAAFVTGGTLGSSKHLSPFQVENITNVNLVPSGGFAWSKSGNSVGKPFRPTPLYQILSGGDTPFHQPNVLVWIEAIGNQGTNVDVCNNWAWTDPNGVATFTNAYLNKAGGYTMVARTDGTQTNSNIPAVPSGRSALSPLINIKNGNPLTCLTYHSGDKLPDNPGPNGTP